MAWGVAGLDPSFDYAGETDVCRVGRWQMADGNMIAG